MSRLSRFRLRTTTTNSFIWSQPADVFRRLFFYGVNNENEELKEIWAEKFKQVPGILENVRQVKSAATAFNTNVDAVLKLKGADLEN